MNKFEEIMMDNSIYDFPRPLRGAVSKIKRNIVRSNLPAELVSFVDQQDNENFKHKLYNNTASPVSVEDKNYFLRKLVYELDTRHDIPEKLIRKYIMPADNDGYMMSRLLKLEALTPDLVREFYFDKNGNYIRQNYNHLVKEDDFMKILKLYDIDINPKRYSSRPDIILTTADIVGCMSAPVPKDDYTVYQMYSIIWNHNQKLDIDFVFDFIDKNISEYDDDDILVNRKSIIKILEKVKLDDEFIDLLWTPGPNIITISLDKINTAIDNKYFIPLDERHSISGDINIEGFQYKDLMLMMAASIMASGKPEFIKLLKDKYPEYYEEVEKELDNSNSADKIISDFMSNF